MQPHDPEDPSPRAAIPDDTSRTEHDAVSTDFEPGTGRTLKLGAGIAAAVLLLCFVVVKVIRLVDAHSLAKASNAAYTAPPPVDVTWQCCPYFINLGHVPQVIQQLLVNSTSIRVD